jgi:hypothetical protein
MCKWSSGCGSSDKIKCKNCGVDLCKQCSRCLATGQAPPGGNSAQCPAGNHNFRWLMFINKHFIYPMYLIIFWN